MSNASHKRGTRSKAPDQFPSILFIDPPLAPIYHRIFTAGWLTRLQSSVLLAFGSERLFGKVIGGSIVSATTRRLKIAAMAIAFGLAAGPVVAQSGTIPLRSMTGTWTGTGWGTRHVDAPRETVRCRLTSKFSTRERQLKLTGKCAGAARSYAVSGYLKQTAGGNVTGRWSNPNGIGAINIAGERKGNTITFKVKAKDSQSNEQRTFSMVWAMTRNTMTVDTRLADHETKPVGSIRFVKR